MKEIYYYYEPSGRIGEAVAYIRGEHPGYALEEGKRIEDWTIPHFDVGGFDRVTGGRTPHGKLTDFLNNSVGWLLVSKKVRELLTEAGIGGNTVQWLEVCLHHEGKESRDEYFAGNVLDVRSAVNRAKSRYVGRQQILTYIVLSRDAVQGLELFRLKERSTRVYFSARLRKMLLEQGTTGVDWQPTKVAE